MSPTKISPYYFKAPYQPPDDAITLSTIVSRDRLPVLSRLATRYRGPISAAIHVHEEKDDGMMQELQTLIHSQPDMQRYVDIHVIQDRLERQFNLWRNVARLYARTDYVMMLDVDFYLATLPSLPTIEPTLQERLAQGTAAAVIPAFEYVDRAEGEDWRTFPTDKASLSQVYRQGRIDMFHRSWVRGHGATNYTRWFDQDQAYPVVDYDYAYEPYIVFKKHGPPWCDERFVGYGANKAACLYEMYLSGVEFWVLPILLFIRHTIIPRKHGLKR